jgi:hypothetical protein
MLRDMSERIDNIVPLHHHGAEPSTAGWDPPPPVDRDLGVHVAADVAIPMPDGTTLAADVYRPKQPGRYPVILAYSAYSLDLATAEAPVGTNEIPSPAWFVPHGYVVVLVTARGVGRSGGEFQLWFNTTQVDDLETCIAWAAAQTWSNGDVAMHGTSYYGMIQPLVAVRRPPALKAFFANEICTSYARHTYRYGGSPNVDFLSLWAGSNFTPSAMHRHVPPVLRAALSWILGHDSTWKIVGPHVDDIMASFKNRRGVHPTALAAIEKVIAGEDREFPAGPSRELAKIEIPFVVVQNRGIVSIHQLGAYDLFEHARSAQRWLIVGPAEYESPVRLWEREALAFFDYILKGASNGYAEQPRVRYYKDGDERWASASDFPATDSEETSLFLSREALTAAPAAGEVSWLAIPRGMDALPELGPQQLAFHWTAPRALDLFGPVTLTLKLSSNEIDAIVCARLDLVKRDGSRHHLGFGVQRASSRALEPGSRAELAHDPYSRIPLVPFEPTELAFSISPVAAHLDEGDHLELALASRHDLVKARIAEGYMINDAPVPFFARVKLHLGRDTRLTLTTRNGP